jgi:hypothetical protein
MEKENMKRPIKCLLAIVVATVSGGSHLAFAQSPAYPAPEFPGNDCNSCSPSTQPQVGYAGTRAPARGLFHSQAAEQHHLMFERNQAWPKPFACWDRTAYLSIWQQMYTSGLAYECTLSDNHFDPETGRLNRMGERKLQTVMQNHPEWQRGLLVAQNRDPATNQLRMESVRNTVRQWYGDEIASQVAFTSIVPEPASGAKIQAINIGYGASLPPPTINQSGSGNSASVGSTSGGAGTGGQ